MSYYANNVYIIIYLIYKYIYLRLLHNHTDISTLLLLLHLRRLLHWRIRWRISLLLWWRIRWRVSLLLWWRVIRVSVSRLLGHSSRCKTLIIRFALDQMQMQMQTTRPWVWLIIWLLPKKSS